MIGLDVGGAKCLGMVVRADDEVLAQTRTSTRTGSDAVIDMLAEVVAELTEIVPATAIGVGMPGLIDTQGVLRRAPNLVETDELAVRELLEDRTGLPVVCDNDANCAARAELILGAAAGVSEAVMITLGTGIGSALVVGGELRRGSHGMAGELGHIIVDSDGPLCGCGRRGCWERYASRVGLGRLAQEAARAGKCDSVLDLAGGSIDDVTSEHVIRAAEADDDEAFSVLDEFSYWLALGISNIVATLDPEMIVVGGGLVDAWDLYADLLDGHYDQLELAASHRPRIRIEQARLGERAGALGAAFMAKSANL